MEIGDMLLRDGAPDDPAGRWLSFGRMRGALVASQARQIPGILEEIQSATAAGNWVAGYLGYEAAAGFDPAFKVKEVDRPIPLFFFGIYDAPEILTDLPGEFHDESGFQLEQWRPGIGNEAYGKAIEAIRELIAAGDTYQVNFTYPLTTLFTGSVQGLFGALWRAQPTAYAACLKVLGGTIVSASPELFFEQSGERVVTRPMKGTARRGRFLEEDERLMKEFAGSEKERAENVMIVDLLRNDLGRVAKAGSVKVEKLFEVEKYPGLLQMTSTISAKTDADPVDVLAALFPCGSVTGAPKIRTMEIIAELEQEPRGVYTGAIGWIAPDRRARFSVAIRTLEISGHCAVYGVGGGITWGSDAEAERRESQLKAAMLLKPQPNFELLDALLWRDGAGFPLIETHLERLRESAEYFGFGYDESKIREHLAEVSCSLSQACDRSPRKVVLKMAKKGEVVIHAELLDGEFISADTPCPPPASDLRKPWRVGISAEPVDSSDVFLFHKTTLREKYHKLKSQHPDCDDVLLFNERDELTESCRCNVVLKIEGDLWTPARECGLLNGVQRRRLLKAGIIRERVIKKDEIRTAEGVWLINAVRGWIFAVKEKCP